MGFKEMVAADRSAVFHDLDFFGETYRVEAKTITIVAAPCSMPGLRICRNVAFPVPI